MSLYECIYLFVCLFHICELQALIRIKDATTETPAESLNFDRNPQTACETARYHRRVLMFLVAASSKLSICRHKTIDTVILNRLISC